MKKSKEIEIFYNIKIPNNSKIFIDRHLEHFEDISDIEVLKNKLMTIWLRGVGRFHYYSIDDQWLKNDFFKLDKDDVYVVAEQIYYYIEKFADGYKGVEVSRIVDGMKNGVVSKDVVLKSIELLKKEYLICYNPETNTTFPFKWTD